MRKVWGIHNDTLTTELVDEGFVSIGWDDAGDLQRIPDGREGLKTKLDALLPDAKPRAVALWAGILLRFRDDITVVESNGNRSGCRAPSSRRPRSTRLAPC